MRHSSPSRHAGRNLRHVANEFDALVRERCTRLFEFIVDTIAQIDWHHGLGPTGVPALKFQQLIDQARQTIKSALDTSILINVPGGQRERNSELISQLQAHIFTTGADSMIASIWLMFFLLNLNLLRNSFKVDQLIFL